MKPPVRGDGFVMYHPLEADFRSRQAMQDSLKRETLLVLAHLHFLVPEAAEPAVKVLRPHEVSHASVSKEQSLIIIPRSQAIPLEKETVPVSAAKSGVYKRRENIMFNRKNFTITLLLLLVAFAGYKWGYSRGAKSCGEKPAEQKPVEPKLPPKATPAPAPAPATPAPFRETKITENFNELVFINQLGTPAKVEYIDNDTNEQKVKMVGSKGFGLRVYAKETNLMVSGKRKTFRFKSTKGNRIVYKIKG